MAAKVRKVKWAIGAEEPDDLQDFLSNDDIEEKHGRPPRGNYTLQVKRVTVREIKSGDNAGGDRLNLMLIINEPSKSDKSVFNSYLVWDGMNVTEQGKPFIKRWLKALGLEWDDFYSKSKQDDEDPPHITQIGKVKFESDKVVNLRATLKTRTNNNTGDPEVVVGRYLPLDDDVDEGEDEAAEEEESVSLDEAEEDEPDDDDDSDDDSDEDEDEWTREDLEDEDLSDIKKIAKDDFGLKAADLKGKDKEALLDLLFPEDEEDEDEDEEDEDEPDEDEVEELTEELQGMKIAGLRKRALRNDSDADLDGMKKKDLVQLILEQELNVPPF